MGLYVVSLCLSQGLIGKLNDSKFLPAKGGKVKSRDMLPKGSKITEAKVTPREDGFDVAFETKEGKSGSVTFYLSGNNWQVDPGSVKISPDKTCIEVTLSNPVTSVTSRPFSWTFVKA